MGRDVCIIIYYHYKYFDMDFISVLTIIMKNTPNYTNKYLHLLHWWFSSYCSSKRQKFPNLTRFIVNHGLHVVPGTDTSFVALRYLQGVERQLAASAKLCQLSLSHSPVMLAVFFSPFFFFCGVQFPNTNSSRITHFGLEVCPYQPNSILVYTYQRIYTFA